MSSAMVMGLASLVLSSGAVTCSVLTVWYARRTRVALERIERARTR